MVAVERERLETHLHELRGYIRRVADRTRYKTVLFAVEDLVQEAAIVLWRVLTKYPKAEGVDLIRLFKRSLTNRLASLFRTEAVKMDRKVRSLDEAREEMGDRIEFHIRLKTGGAVTPWTFYKHALRMLRKKIGVVRLREMIEGDTRRMNDGPFSKKKEEIMRSL